MTTSSNSRRALFHRGPGVQQHRHDRGVADAAAVGRASDRALLGGGKYVGLAGLGGAGALDGDAHSGLLVHQCDRCEGLVDGGGLGPVLGKVPTPGGDRGLGVAGSLVNLPALESLGLPGVPGPLRLRG
jgi:hypothetical protein